MYVCMYVFMNNLTGFDVPPSGERKREGDSVFRVADLRPCEQSQPNLLRYPVDLVPAGMSARPSHQPVQRCSGAATVPE